jgi:outer membrane protein assembly factor BamB
MSCNSFAFRRTRLFAILAVLAFAAVGCTTSPQQTLPNADSTDANGVARSKVGSNDDWTTFAHDYTRSGYDPDTTQLTRATVPKLRLRWEKNVGEEVFASPVAYAGNVIVVSEGKTAHTRVAGSVVYDFSAADGHVIWKKRLGDDSQMTPTIDPDEGLVIVANQRKNHRDLPSHLFALRLLDGSVAWTAPLLGQLRAAPVVANGMVYVGRAGGDPPACRQGGVSAVDESTGNVVWTWNVDPQPDEGGSVWGAIAYDGTLLSFGTGNTCQTPVPTANGAVALDVNGNVVWDMVAVKGSNYDADTGGGVMLSGGLAHFINKNGTLYAVNQETGNISWSRDLNPGSGPGNWNGGFATPTTDGSTIVEASGLYSGSSPTDSGEFCMLAVAAPAEVFPGFYSKLRGMNMSGRLLWTRKMQNRIVGYVALSQGVGYVGLNKHFTALDAATGKTLWTHATPAYIDASMVVVPSGLYGADDAGNVYAFGLKPGTR